MICWFDKVSQAVVVTTCEGGKIKLYKFDAAAQAAPPSLKRRVGASNQPWQTRSTDHKTEIDKAIIIWRRHGRIRPQSKPLILHKIWKLAEITHVHIFPDLSPDPTGYHLLKL